MKTSIGGDRLGAGGKMDVHMKNYGRSSHNLSATWRSSMASGTLVPFMSELALPGDVWNIDLAANVLTLPTIGPLFGSYKVQLDVFQIPIRLYNAGLHNNRLGIGMDMSKVKIPQVKVEAYQVGTTETTNGYENNGQISPSSIFKYLGISGVAGGSTNLGQAMSRQFNAVPFLAYWDIYKNYYANKMEQRGVVIHTGASTNDIVRAEIQIGSSGPWLDVFNTTQIVDMTSQAQCRIGFDNTLEPDVNTIIYNQNNVDVLLNTLWTTLTWNAESKQVSCSGYTGNLGTNRTQRVNSQSIVTSPTADGTIQLQEFELDSIDKMRDLILQHPFESGAFEINKASLSPYSLPMQDVTEAGTEIGRRSAYFTQEGLGIKTYQSDLFNNWMDTEWIDGTNGINEVTAVSTVGDKFTIDALNIANKVYIMLNRIAISGGTYDDWLEAVYTNDRAKAVESPVYQGSLIKELAFQEVVSNASSVKMDAAGDLAPGDPLGTLAGRGQLTGKNKGGKMTVKVDEPAYIMGIVSITPKLDYSQGNKWDMQLKTLDDLHKPQLDGIGYQDLVTENMVFSDTEWNNGSQTATKFSAGKQPAWINYMTEVNRTYGNFAIEGDQMWMTLNRNYDIDPNNGKIEDLTTYIDPTKFNQIFSDVELSSQNFWVQISKDMTVRRKMSAKIIPNL